MDEDRAAFRRFGRMYVRREREIALAGTSAIFADGVTMLREMARLLEHPRFGPPLGRMLERLNMILSSVYGTTS